MNVNLILATTAVPLLAALAIWLLPGATGTADRRARWIALAGSVLALLLAVAATVRHDRLVALHDGDFSAVYGQGLRWLAADDSSGIDIRFSLGLDGLSLWLFDLTALLMITAVLVSWEAIRDRAAAFYALLMLLESGLFGVFMARDIVLFYIFFEFTLIPLFFLIGIWGHEKRQYAAVKFFLYTFAGSVLTFLGLLALVVWNYFHAGNGVLTFSIPDLQAGLAAQPVDMKVPLLNVDLGLLIFLALFAGFAIKVPLFPLHTWLPLAHVEAPTAGSVVLAGVLLKIGTYGFLRFSLPMLPEASVQCMPWILGLSVAGIVYGALVALAQGDIKRLIAYSSVSHLGFCMIGLFAFNRAAVEGGTLQMINHGLSTGGLFALVGMLYERYHTREIRQLGGLATRTPWLAAMMVVFALSSLGLPGLNGFAGEFLLLLGMFQRAWTAAPPEWEMLFKTLAILSVFGVVLGAWYLLWMVRRVFFGPLVEPEQHGQTIRDLSLREIAALAPLVVVMFWIGLFPNFFLARIAPQSDPIADRVAEVIERRLPQAEVSTATATRSLDTRIAIIRSAGQTVLGESQDVFLLENEARRDH